MKVIILEVKWLIKFPFSISEYREGFYLRYKREIAMVENLYFNP